MCVCIYIYICFIWKQPYLCSVLVQLLSFGRSFPLDWAVSLLSIPGLWGEPFFFFLCFQGSALVLHHFSSMHAFFVVQYKQGKGRKQKIKITLNLLTVKALLKCENSGESSPESMLLSLPYPPTRPLSCPVHPHTCCSASTGAHCSALLQWCWHGAALQSPGRESRQWPAASRRYRKKLNSRRMLRLAVGNLRF